MEFQINIIAVLVATVANFIFGFLWYTPLFGKVWAREQGFDTNMKVTPGEMARGLIFSVVGNFLMGFVLAHNIEAWTFVPGTEDMGAAGKILNAAVFTWLGFYFPVDLGAVAWERKSWKVFGINTGYHLVMLAIAGSILVLW